MTKHIIIPKVIPKTAYSLCCISSPLEEFSEISSFGTTVFETSATNVAVGVNLDTCVSVFDKDELCVDVVVMVLELST